MVLGAVMRCCVGCIGNRYRYSMMTYVSISTGTMGLVQSWIRTTTRQTIIEKYMFI